MFGGWIEGPLGVLLDTRTRRLSCLMSGGWIEGKARIDC